MDNISTIKYVEDNSTKYILQIVLQSTLNKESPLRIYNNVEKLEAISNYNISLSEIMENRSSKTGKCKISGYKIIPNNNQKKIEYRIHHLSVEEQVKIDTCSFIQYRIETTDLNHLKLKILINSTNDIYNKSNYCLMCCDEYFYATFIGTQFIHDYESPHKSVVSSVLDKDFNIIGELKLEYTIIKQWKEQKEFSKKFTNYSISQDINFNQPLMVGHRGSGVTYCDDPSEYMENTINSFLAAYENGADFVELDIQLTKDNNVVVYHDADTCIVLPLSKKVPSKKNLNNKSNYKSNSDIDKLLRPISYDIIPDNDMLAYVNKHIGDYLENSEDYYCNQLKPTTTPTTTTIIDANNNDDDNDDDEDSCSTTDSVSSLNVSIRHLNMDHLKTQKFINSKCDILSQIKNGKPQSPILHKNISLSNPIGFLFPTLSEVLSALPASLGVNIEIKSPQESKTGIWETDYGQNYDRNKLVDLTLEAILNEEHNKRRIIFSSFDPWICIMLKNKQDRYPVLLLIEPTVDTIEESTDIRMSSVEGATLFAVGEKLDGIVCCIDYVINKIDDVSKYVHNHNLVLFTYGEKNNIFEVIIKQKLARIDGIITDRLKQLLPQMKLYDKDYHSN